jgi:hypothetical protein
MEERGERGGRTYPKMEETKIWRSTFLVTVAPLLLHAVGSRRQGTVSGERQDS